MSSSRIPIIALVGQTNVGKSSLFNLLLKSRRNIVAREAGTTRDSIAEIVEISGRTAWLTDTAGLKNADNDFEAGIQEQIEAAVGSADLICLLVDASAPLSTADRQLAKKALKSRKPVILIANKIDRNRQAREEDFLRLGIADVLLLSVTTREGLDKLLQCLKRHLPKVKPAVKDQPLKIALLGRPNAGKSALFNALVQKRQAYVADEPGTTRDINRCQIQSEQEAFEMLDTAGVRRSGKIAVGVEKFSVLRTLTAIEESDVCLLLMDVEQTATAVDQKIAGLVKDAGKGLILVVSKWDSRPDKDAEYADRLAAQLRQAFDFVPWTGLIFSSAKEERNLAKIFEMASAINKRRSQEITTSKLNVWLQASVSKQPPAGLKDRQPKLNYVTQIGRQPPTFAIFGRFVDYLHWSYKRFLERRLREEFDFQGTAIKLQFREKSQPTTERRL